MHGMLSLIYEALLVLGVYCLGQSSPIARNHSIVSMGHPRGGQCLDQIVFGSARKVLNLKRFGTERVNTPFFHRIVAPTEFCALVFFVLHVSFLIS